jgi:[protein-PII] uridylyltransferase
MTEISQYRDVDQEDIVRSFADTVKTSDRLRALFLLSYCDLAAVGPDVWNEWKGMLLLKLYLRTERILEGGAETAGDAFLTSPKADEVRACARKDLRNAVEEHLRDLGERYLAAFTPKEIALHLECVAEARETGLSVHASTDEVGGMTRIVVSTLDRPGLFSEIAGGLVAQLVDINNAALFTRKDGYVVDCFVVAEASRRRPLTRNELAGVERVLEAVLIRGENVQHYVEQSRRRLFALLQPRVPVPTRIDFDNVSSRTHTVIDIQTGDRTGLLYDITRALTELGADISTARIVTDVRYVRDSFYVTINGERVLSENQQAAVRERLHEAIYPRAIADDADRGDTS